MDEMTGICAECKDHCGFEPEVDKDGEETGQYYSECCGASPYDMDPDVDMER